MRQFRLLVNVPGKAGEKVAVIEASSSTSAVERAQAKGLEVLRVLPSSGAEPAPAPEPKPSPERAQGPAQAPAPGIALAPEPEPAPDAVPSWLDPAGVEPPATTSQDRAASVSMPLMAEHPPTAAQLSELSPKQLQKVIERGVRWGVIKAVLTLQLIALLTILVLTLIGAALVMLGVLTRG